jgi:hypothetical protein
MERYGSNQNGKLGDSSLNNPRWVGVLRGAILSLLEAVQARACSDAVGYMTVLLLCRFLQICHVLLRLMNAPVLWLLEPVQARACSDTVGYMTVLLPCRFLQIRHVLLRLMNAPVSLPEPVQACACSDCREGDSAPSLSIFRRYDTYCYVYVFVFACRRPNRWRCKPLIPRCKYCNLLTYFTTSLQQPDVTCDNTSFYHF